MKTVPLHGKRAAGRVALVDDGADYEQVSQHRWWAIEVGRNKPKITYAYARLRNPDGTKGKFIYMHRMITTYRRVDHRDGNGLNNQQSNLRECTQSQNNANARRPADNTSGYKGVSWDKNNRRWKAAIGVDGRIEILGMFTDAIEAALVYDAAALKFFGEFARLNLPDGRL